MKNCNNHPDSFSNRREFLQNFGLGFGGLSLMSLFNNEAAAAPFTSKQPHFPVKAKSVIQLFAGGAPSHVDTFDYKPELQKRNGEKIGNDELLASPFNFVQQGKSGVHISEVWDDLGKHADDIAIINSMFAEIPDHGIAAKMMHTGSAQLPKPSLGSWLVYGLGTVNQNMPGFISLNGGAEWRQSAFLPGMFQGCNVQYRSTMRPSEIMANIRSEFSAMDRQRRQIDFSRQLNALHMEQLQKDSQLEARIEAFETAFKMQVEATDAFDISKEPQSVRALYGENEEAAKLIVARRLVERGVRFIQVNVGGWDHHENIKMSLANTANRYDQAIAGLITDLKKRGLFDSTLIIWGGEFGRTVTAGGSAGAPGRDHNGKAFSIWLAGADVKGGQRYGETDELGMKAEKDRVHVHDLHATVLRLMGFDHTKLTYNYNGREFRLTDNYGNVIKDIVS